MENEMGTEKRTEMGNEIGKEKEAGKEKETGKEVDQSRRFMRKNYAFFGGISALYALFYTFCLYRTLRGSPGLFSRQEPWSILAYV